MPRLTRSSARSLATPPTEEKTSPKQTQYGNLENWLDEQPLEVSETKISACLSRQKRDAQLAGKNQKTKSKVSLLTSFLSVDLNDMSSESEDPENDAGADHITRAYPPVPDINLTREYSEQQKIDFRAKFREEDRRHFLANRQPGEKYPGDNPLPDELNEEAIEEYLASDQYKQEQKALAKQKRRQEAAEERRRKAEAQEVVNIEQAANRRASGAKAAATRAANKSKMEQVAAALDTGEEVDNTRRSARDRRPSKRASADCLTDIPPAGTASKASSPVSQPETFVVIPGNVAPKRKRIFTMDEEQETISQGKPNTSVGSSPADDSSTSEATNSRPKIKLKLKLKGAGTKRALEIKESESLAMLEDK